MCALTQDIEFLTANSRNSKQLLHRLSINPDINMGFFQKKKRNYPCIIHTRLQYAT